MALRLLPALAALILLPGCEARIGQDGDGEKTAADGNVAGEAEEGRFSIEAPGFAMKIDIPESIAESADVDSDSGILYPGSKLSGMHIEASDDKAGSSGVELRFTSPDTPDRIAAWYRDPARAADFTIASAAREGDAILIRGTEKDDGDPFALRLTPRQGGGSDARLTLRDRN